MSHAKLIGPLTIALLSALPGMGAAATAEEATTLGKELTPMGSLRAGNADGSVPEYTGASNFDIPLSINYKGQPVSARTITRQMLIDLWDQFEDFRQNGSPGLRAKVEDIIQGEPREMRAKLEALQKDIEQNWPTYYKELPADYKTRLIAVGKTFSIAGKPALTGDSEAALREQVQGLISVFNDQIAQLKSKLGTPDQPLYTITPANLAQHADKLTEGHKALFKTYPTY
ncbi:MAG: DUF1329 domain-containing protein, partial [Nevskiales bacterium]